MLFPRSRAIFDLVWLAVLVVPLAPVRSVRAQNASLASPVGRWETIDDVTGKPKSIVAISEENGTLFGRIETIFNPPVPHPTCYLCRGAMKDRPLIGLQILWGFHQNGNQWSGGQVLDPETGRIYRATLAPEDGGKKLRLHGYFGISLFGRTQYWWRAK